MSVTFTCFDPEVIALSAERIDDDIRQFRLLLDSNAQEPRVQEFLAAHTYFFNGFVAVVWTFSNVLQYQAWD
jgi:hypothetical protein